MYPPGCLARILAVVQLELVLKGHGFTGCGKSRVETGLAPSNATRKLWFDRFLKGPGFSRAVSIVLSLRLYSR
jgi:hypothetical protein